MGKTVPSYRIALEWEIDNWKGFRNALHRQEEVEAFDVLMDMARNHASAGGCATNPVLFEPMVMSILLDQQKQIQDLRGRLHELKQKSMPSNSESKP